MNTPEWEELRAFRHEVYPLFGCRRDALFEALDAILSAPTLETPAHLSLSPTCQRGWGSLSDALNVGTMDLAQLERLVASYLLEPQTPWFAVDASVLTVSGRAATPKRARIGAATTIRTGIPTDSPWLAGWNSSWLAQVPLRCSSWTAPLRVRRLLPRENLGRTSGEPQSGGS